MSAPTYQCMVCGAESDADLVAALAQMDGQYWTMHRIEIRGGVVQVMTCPSCASLTQDLIFESYRERIRLGLVPGFH